MAAQVSLEARVMAHPSRRRQAERLALQIGASVVFDPSPGGKPSAWRCAARAWSQEARLATTHILVCQDDALPCDGFNVKVVEAIQRRPQAMLSFYVGSIHHVRRDWIRHERVGAPDVPLPLNHFVPTVALAMPVSVAAAAMAYLGRKLPKGWGFDDEAFKMYRQSARTVGAYATIPCLVSHDNKPRSVMRHGHHGKRVPMG